MNHTPGPWAIDGHTIARLMLLVHSMEALAAYQRCANARLIQAAPLLLAACEDVLLSLVGGVTACGYCERPLDRQSPYSQGQHRQDCPVPGVEAAVKQARTA